MTKTFRKITPSPARLLTGVLSHLGLILVVTPNPRTLVIIIQFLPVILNQTRGKADVVREEAKKRGQKLLVKYNHGGKGNLVPPRFF